MGDERVGRPEDWLGFRVDSPGGPTGVVVGVAFSHDDPRCIEGFVAYRGRGGRFFFAMDDVRDVDDSTRLISISHVPSSESGWLRFRWLEPRAWPVWLAIAADEWVSPLAGVLGAV